MPAEQNSHASLALDQSKHFNFVSVATCARVRRLPCKTCRSPRRSICHSACASCCMHSHPGLSAQAPRPTSPQGTPNLECNASQFTSAHLCTFPRFLPGASALLSACPVTIIRDLVCACLTCDLTKAPDQRNSDPQRIRLILFAVALPFLCDSVLNIPTACCLRSLKASSNCWHCDGHDVS